MGLDLTAKIYSVPLGQNSNISGQLADIKNSRFQLNIFFLLFFFTQKTLKGEREEANTNVHRERNTCVGRSEWKQIKMMDRICV